MLSFSFFFLGGGGKDFFGGSSFLVFMRVFFSVLFIHLFFFYLHIFLEMAVTFKRSLIVNMPLSISSYFSFFSLQTQTC